MNRRTRITVIAATFTALLALPATAQAADPAANDYGQHVRHCAQTMGFTGTHNPGMHHGNAGWTGMTCQP
jgi:hypothetical protein